MSECKHLLELDQCSHCNGKRPPGITSDLCEAVTRSRFDGRCGFCESRIIEGAAIGLTEGEWIHLNHFEGDL